MNFGELLTGKLQVTCGVFANDWLLMVTSYVVPFDAIAIKVVQDSQTSFFFTSLLFFLTVVWLSSWWVETERIKKLVVVDFSKGSNRVTR